MRVHLVTEKTLRLYARFNPQVQVSMLEFVTKIKGANWIAPEDILQDFSSADLLGRGSSRVVFNLAGNKYRLICKYVFGESQVRLYVLWVGTHANYTRICQRNEQFIIAEY
jgi:mRNA interferase HigB